MIEQFSLWCNEFYLCHEFWFNVPKQRCAWNAQGRGQGEWHALWKQVHGKTTWWSRCIELTIKFGSWGSKVPRRLGWQGITWDKVLHALVLCKEQGIQGDFLWDASHLNDSCGAKQLDWELLWLDCRIWPWGCGRQDLGLFEKFGLKLSPRLE